MAQAVIAIAAVFVPLAAWRLAYPLTDLGLLALAVLAAAVFCGSWRNSLRRRRAWLEAALQPTSVLRSVLSGQLGALAAALCSTCAAIPAVGYFALTSSAAEWWFIFALASTVVLATVVLRRVAILHVRWTFLSAASTPMVVALVGTAFAVVYVWLSFSVLDLPSYLGKPSLGETLRAALADLPARDHLMAEVLALFRSSEALTLWLLKIEGFTRLGPLILFLLFNTLICYGLAKVAAEVSSLVAEGVETWERGHDEL